MHWHPMRPLSPTLGYAYELKVHGTKTKTKTVLCSVSGKFLLLGLQNTTSSCVLHLKL